MTAPVVNLRKLRTYAEQHADKAADLARRSRNRMLALVALGVIAAVVIVQLLR